MADKEKRNASLRKIIFNHTKSLLNISNLIDDAIINFSDTFDREPNLFSDSDMDFISRETELSASYIDISKTDLFIMKGIGLEI